MHSHRRSTLRFSRRVALETIALPIYTEKPSRMIDFLKPETVTAVLCFLVPKMLSPACGFLCDLLQSTILYSFQPGNICGDWMGGRGGMKEIRFDSIPCLPVTFLCVGATYVQNIVFRRTISSVQQ